MTIRFKKTTVLVLLFTLALSLVTYSKTYSRNITAWFNNIQVVLDGKALNLSSEPFIFENKVYVPIEELSDDLYVNVDYDDEEKKLSINTNRPYAADSNLPIAYQKENELALLRHQNQELQKEIDLLKNDKYKGAEINTIAEMESYLKENFKHIEDVNTKIQLVNIAKNRFALNIIFSYFDITKWNVLERRTIENYVDDINYAIRDLYNSEAQIEGSIRHDSTYNNTKLVSYYTRGDRLYYDFTNATLKKNQYVDGVNLEEELKDNLSIYNSNDFKYEAFVSQNDVDLFITSDDNFFKWSPSLKMNYLRRLKAEIIKVNPYIYINGRIKYGDEEFKFSIENDIIRSVDLLIETEDYINLYHKGFSYYETFGFTFTISEGYSNSFKIDIQGNFSDDNENWNLIKTYTEPSFRYYIQAAYQYVENIWDVDIFGELTDKDQKSLADLEFYRTATYAHRRLLPITFKED